MAGPVDVKQKESKSIGCWANNVIFMVNFFLKSHISGMRGQIDIQQMGWTSVIHDYDRGHFVTKMRCKDLPDGEMTGFRYRRLVRGENRMKIVG